MINNNKKINIGIGLITSRKNFEKVAKAYIQCFTENEYFDKSKYALHLFVAYDLKYTDTQVSDYRITDGRLLEHVDSAYYLDSTAITTESENLVKNKVITAKEANLIFGEGYARKRNAVLYFAVKKSMDSLIFLDEDEYPLANIKLDKGIAWRGQDVLSSHIKGLQIADMTHGYHCGYISPIPQLQFNEQLSEQEFKLFIEAISNDIINWYSLKEKMKDGGITYADTAVMNREQMIRVETINGMKFISGANLAINLKDRNKVFPFYNPPGARGEEAFLSTCIDSCEVLKVGCYTFHDAFSAYGQILNGVLPESLKVMKTDTPSASKRFLKAAVGWIRFKPLLLYITQPETYEKKMEEIEEKLTYILPKICLYFGTKDFQVILNEFNGYRKNVLQHFDEFENTKKAWIKIMSYEKKI